MLGMGSAKETTEHCSVVSDWPSSYPNPWCYELHILKKNVIHSEKHQQRNRPISQTPQYIRQTSHSAPVGGGVFLLRWCSPSTMWTDLLIFLYHHQGCLKNPVFSNLWLCAACWACLWVGVGGFSNESESESENVYSIYLQWGVSDYIHRQCSAYTGLDATEFISETK